MYSRKTSCSTSVWRAYPCFFKLLLYDTGEFKEKRKNSTDPSKRALGQCAHTPEHNTNMDMYMHTNMHTHIHACTREQKQQQKEVWKFFLIFQVSICLFVCLFLTVEANVLWLKFSLMSPADLSCTCFLTASLYKASDSARESEAPLHCLWSLPDTHR